MKKKIAIAVAAVGVLSAASAFATAGNSNIINSRHNLNSKVLGSYGFGSGGSLNPVSSQICVYCHTPHNARSSVPLWNRAQDTDINSFRLYSSVTMLNSKHTTGFTSDSISLFCMSCHDGSPLGNTMIHNQGALGNFYGSQTNFGNGTNIQTQAKLGTDLRTTHPVNFVADYQKTGQARLDGMEDLNYTSRDLMGPYNDHGGTLNLGPKKTFPLFVSNGTPGYLECSSCHSVHDDYYRPFLRDTMDNSKLCLGCHNK